MATLPMHTPGQSRFSKALPERPAIGDYRAIPLPLDSQLHIHPALRDMPPNMPILHRAVGNRDPNSKGHVKQPWNISGSSVYSTDTRVTHDSWENVLDQGEATEVETREERERERERRERERRERGERNMQFLPEPPVPENQTRNSQEIIPTARRLHSNSISSQTSSPPRPPLWRRRSSKERPVNIPELKLLNSNGFTANQQLPQLPQLPQLANPSPAPRAPLPPVPRQYSAEFPSSPTERPRPQLQPQPHPFSPNIQYVTRLDEDDFDFVPSKQTRKPIPLRPVPAPPQPESMGSKLSKMRNKFKSSENLRLEGNEDVPAMPKQSMAVDNTGVSKSTPVRNKLLPSDPDDRKTASVKFNNGHSEIKEKTPTSAFRKLRNKLRSSDNDESPPGTGVSDATTAVHSSDVSASTSAFSKLKHKLRSPSTEESLFSSAVTSPHPSLSLQSPLPPPTPEYGVSDPDLKPITQKILELDFPPSPLEDRSASPRSISGPTPFSPSFRNDGQSVSRPGSSNRSASCPQVHTHPSSSRPSSRDQSSQYTNSRPGSRDQYSQYSDSRPGSRDQASQRIDSGSHSGTPKGYPSLRPQGSQSSLIQEGSHPTLRQQGSQPTLRSQGSVPTLRAQGSQPTLRGKSSQPTLRRQPSDFFAQNPRPNTADSATSQNIFDLPIAQYEAYSQNPHAPAVVSPQPQKTYPPPVISPLSSPSPTGDATAQPSGGRDYPLLAPGPISNRMSTILESSPFLALASRRASPRTPRSGSSARTPKTGQSLGAEMTTANGDEAHRDADAEGLRNWGVYGDGDDEDVIYDTLPLNSVQQACYISHKAMRRSRNDVYSLCCALCGVRDRRERWGCVWCSVRVCGGCKRGLIHGDEKSRNQEKGNLVFNFDVQSPRLEVQG